PGDEPVRPARNRRRHGRRGGGRRDRRRRRGGGSDRRRGRRGHAGIEIGDHVGDERVDQRLDRRRVTEGGTRRLGGGGVLRLELREASLLGREATVELRLVDAALVVGRHALRLGLLVALEEPDQLARETLLLAGRALADDDVRV